MFYVDLDNEEIVDKEKIKKKKSQEVVDEDDEL